MKSTYILLGIVLVAVVAGGYFLLSGRQTAKVASKNIVSNETSMEDKQGEEAMMGLGYILKDGKMMIEENHAFRTMTEDVTLKDGTTVATTGVVTKKDGSSITLKEGQSMWTDGSFMEAEAMMEDSGMNSNNSSIETRYVDYSTANLTNATTNSGKAILFFAALAWCPSCQAADRDFKANFDKVPSDVTILKVNYDTAKDLKKKYAITMQDTFVQVDGNGKEVTRWNSGGQGVKALLANAK